ncbi:MAG: hypothetical protein R6U57_13485, partial [Anaerolineales bacterium]
MQDIQKGRDFMKAYFGRRPERRADQQRGVPYPPLQKEVEEGETLALPPVDPGVVSKPDFYTVVEERQSRRNYSNHPLTLK